MAVKQNRELLGEKLETSERQVGGSVTKMSEVQLYMCIFINNDIHYKCHNKHMFKVKYLK